MSTPELKVLDYMAYDDGREERIQSLEKANTVNTAELTGVALRLDYIDKNIADIGTKIDTLVSPIVTRLNQIDDRADEHSKVLGALSDAAKAKQERWAGIRKVSLALFIATAGVAGKELFVFLWHFFSK